MMKKITRPIATLFLLLLTIQYSPATIYSTTGDGNWTNPAAWAGGLVAPIPLAAGDTADIQHGITLAADLAIHPGGMLNVNPNGYLNMTGFSIINASNGGGISMGGINVYGTISCSYLRNFPYAWIYIEPTGAFFIAGNVDNQGDIYLSGILEVSNGNFNHLAADIWIYAGGNMTINNGDFNNYSSIRNLFPTSCIRLLGGSFVNQAGGIVAGGGGVSADINVDNSANPIGNWIGVTWCAGVSGINVPPAQEDCNGPCTGPLQVEITSFEAIPEASGQVRIQWTTASEVGSSHFTIERSLDLENFETIGSLQAQGESENVRSYELTDDNHPGGLAYYRLTEIDLEGRANVHKDLVTALLELPEQPVLLYPNPSQGLVHVQWQSHEGQQTLLRISNQMGAELLRKEEQGAETSLDLAHLPAGIYHISIQAGPRTETRKLILY